MAHGISAEMPAATSAADAPSKGDQSPFEEPPALRGGWDTKDKEVDYEKQEA